MIAPAALTVDVSLVPLLLGTSVGVCAGGVLVGGLVAGAAGMSVTT